MRLAGLGLLTLLSALCSGALAETKQCTVITPPTTITAPGAYCLQNDFALSLVSGYAAAIVIASNNVTLDLNAHRIGNLAAGTGTSVPGIFAINRQNITIKNGTLRGFEIGIFITDSANPPTSSQGHVIDGVRLDQNTYEGINLRGNGSIIRNNQVVSTGGTTAFAGADSVGIFVGGNDDRVLNNDVAGTTSTGAGNAYGIEGQTAQGLMVINNRVSGTTAPGPGVEYGIYTTGAPYAILRKNVVSNATVPSNPSLSVGISMDSATDEFVGNVVEGFGSLTSGGVDPSAQTIVQVSVVANDPNGYALSYRWKATDGAIVDVNAPTTTWALPKGPGLHFAYVMVSNGMGGYTERRLKLSTDATATPLPTPSPVSFTVPPSPAASSGVLRTFVKAAALPDSSLSQYTTSYNYVYLPDIQVYTDLGAGKPAVVPSSDLRGEVILPNAYPLVNGSPTNPGNAYCSADGITFLQCTLGDFEGSNGGPDFSLSVYGGISWLSPQPAAGTLELPGMTGAFLLQDGSPCGTVNRFFGVESWAWATLLSSTGIGLGTVRVGADGGYAFPYDATAASVLLSCEGSNSVRVSIPLNGGGVPLPNIPTAVLPNSAAPTVTSMSATLGTQTFAMDPPATGLPSDNLPGPNFFLSYQGSDTRMSACQYYKAVGAVKGCDAAGNPSGAISFDDWKRTNKIDQYATVGTVEYGAQYVNQVDLNLTRIHHSISYGPNQTAAYVCNHAGPPFSLTIAQSDVNTAVANAVAGLNMVACVAMDNAAYPGVNGGAAFTRFFIFSPSGQLMTSINLDGRGEKFVPGSCVACHGGHKYAGRFPEDGSGLPDIGAHFLPYDDGNFLFSSTAGLTQADQELSIYHLNQNVLNAGPTPAESNLIAGWYTNGSTTLNQSYLPTAWQNLNSPLANSFYFDVVARTCRTCHTALSARYSFDDQPFAATVPAAVPQAFQRALCGYNGDPRLSYAMPNSLVTFNRFWELGLNTFFSASGCASLQKLHY